MGTPRFNEIVRELEELWDQDIVEGYRNLLDQRWCIWDKIGDSDITPNYEYIIGDIEATIEAYEAVMDKRGLKSLV